MTRQPQKVQYTYDNITSMTIQLQEVQYTYDNATAKSTIQV